MELYEGTDSIVEMHPALDVVDDTLYCAVTTRDKEKRPTLAIITSKGEIYNKDEWASHMSERGLQPIAEVVLDPKVRWNIKGMRELNNRTLRKPSWKEAYAAIYGAYDQRLVTDENYIVLAVLHDMLSYFHALFEKLPILHLLGPSDSGKTRLATIKAKIAFNANINAHITPSAFFRSAHRTRCTQIITECDELAELNSGNTFVQYFQSSTTKGEARVTLTESDKNRLTPETFFIHVPCVLGSTKAFKSHPLRNRCIRLDIVKSADPDQEKLDRTIDGPNDDAKVWAPLRDMLYRLLFLGWQEVDAMHNQQKKLITDIKGRSRDKWLPLIALGALVSEEVYHAVCEMARADSEQVQQDTTGSYEIGLMKFAASMVRSGITEISRQDMWVLFRKVDNPNDYDATPEWALETGCTFSLNYIKAKVKGPETLKKELMRLKLIDRPDHGTTGNLVEIKADKIMGVATQYMGNNIFLDDTTSPLEDDDSADEGDFSFSGDDSYRRSPFENYEVMKV